METTRFEELYEHPRWNLVEREKLIIYKGKQILYDDYSNLHGDEFIRILNLHIEATVNRKIFGQLNIIDVTNSYADRQVLATLRQGAKKTDKFNSKTAVIGCVGVLLFFLNLVNQVSDMGLKPFDSMEEALEWLTEDPAS